ncbi:MAG: hypothetical protein U0354_12645 [Candidatus Sericytochromatia bacterium]
MIELLRKIIFLSSILFVSCTLPIQLIEPKVNGVKINFQSNNLTDFTLDEDENIYVVDNNVIKRIDAKTNELTTIAGKEKPDDFPQNGNIDGDIKNAKFGKIKNLFYLESEKVIYLFENFYLAENLNCNGIFSIRKIINNQVSSIYLSNMESSEKCKSSYNKIRNYNTLNIRNENIPTNILENNRTFYSLNETLKKFNFKNNTFETIDNFDNKNSIDSSDTEKSSFTEFTIDDDETLYMSQYTSSKTNSFYVRVNNKWNKVLESPSYISFTSRAQCLYLIDFGYSMPPVSNYKNNLVNDVPKIYKIPKKDIVNNKSLIYLKNSLYLIGIIKDTSFSNKISKNMNNLYVLNNNSISKIIIGDRK